MSRTNPYIKTTWVDEETELSAAQLNRIEQGIYDAHDAVIATEDALATTKANLIEEGTTDTAKKAVSDSLGRAIDATYSTKIELNSALSTKADKTALDAKADKTNTYTKSEVNTALDAKADKTNTYTKSQVDTALNDKADKSTTYTKTETDNLLSAKADKTTVNGIDNRVGALETDIDTLKSVQNVVDVVATYAALQSYVTTNLDANDKVQVIADETHSNASAVYNWTGSAWEYIGAYGGNSYTKAQTDTLLDGKADKSTTYTKTETDTLLNTKADKSTTYTKAEIDTILNTIVIEKYLDSSNVPPITIRGYVTQEVFNSIGPRTQVQLRVYDSVNDITMTFILTQSSPGTDGYGFKCTFNSPLTTDGMIEVDGAIYEDREYIFNIRSYRIYTEDEVDTLLSSKQDTLSGSTSIDITSNVVSVKDSYIDGLFLTDAEMTTLLSEVFD